MSTSITNFFCSTITGRYDFHSIPIQLPTKLIQQIPALKAYYGDQVAEMLTNEEEMSCILELGQQIYTGPSFSKQSFFEAKLQIPGLKNPILGTSKTDLTFKLLLQFSSMLMSYSAAYIPGLRTSYNKFKVTKRRYQVIDSLVVEEIEIDSSIVTEWNESKMMESLQGWWIGASTGSNVLKFNFTNLAPPISKGYKISIYLPIYLDLKLEEIDSYLATNNGWYEIPYAHGFELSVASTMHVMKLSEL